VRFVMPGAEERERIWQVQIHPRKTPLARDVNFRALAQKYEASGGDIKNAVLKAASAAAAEPGSEATKAIHQRHFERAMEDVLAAKSVMQQSLFEDVPPPAIVRVPDPSAKIALAALAIAAAALVVALIALF
jgi:SpoVK/Ycf46/Vps4 family AAA+-type ATPase